MENVRRAVQSGDCGLRTVCSTGSPGPGCCVRGFLSERSFENRDTMVVFRDADDTEESNDRCRTEAC